MNLLELRAMGVKLASPPEVDERDPRVRAMRSKGYLGPLQWKEQISKASVKQTLKDTPLVGLGMGAGYATGRAVGDAIRGRIGDDNRAVKPLLAKGIHYMQKRERYNLSKELQRRRMAAVERSGKPAQYSLAAGYPQSKPTLKREVKAELASAAKGLLGKNKRSELFDNADMSRSSKQPKPQAGDAWGYPDEGRDAYV